MELTFAGLVLTTKTLYLGVEGGGHHSLLPLVNGGGGLGGGPVKPPPSLSPFYRVKQSSTWTVLFDWTE